MVTITIDQQLGFAKKHFSTLEETILFFQELQRKSNEDGSLVDYVSSGKAFSKDENDGIITDKSELKAYLSRAKQK